MSQINLNPAAPVVTAESNGKHLYRLAAVAVMVSVFFMVLDIASTFAFKETIQFGALSATDWFAIFRHNWFSGLRNLGLLNVFEMILSIPMLLAVFAAHLKEYKAFMAFAVILSLVGMAVYISNNAAIPMLVLGGKYSTAASDAQKSLLAAAGEAILARGEDFTPGAFVGFILGEIANLAIAFVMLRGKVFGKVTAYIGIFGIGLLSVYTVWATFIPSGQGVAMAIAMVGGPLGMAWYILIARKLLQLGK